MLNATAIGYLGNDAVVNTTNGKTVINFSIAHTEIYIKDGVKHDRTTWVNCSYWPEKPTVAQYLKKGTQVYVVGMPSTSAYLSKKDGKPAADFRLTVQRLELLGAKKEGTPTQAPVHQMPAVQPAMAGDNDLPEVPDDLPF